MASCKWQDTVLGLDMFRSLVGILNNQMARSSSLNHSLRILGMLL